MYRRFDAIVQLLVYSQDAIMIHMGNVEPEIPPKTGFYFDESM